MSAGAGKLTLSLRKAMTEATGNKALIPSTM
jgi:hypothetical protein